MKMFNQKGFSLLEFGIGMSIALGLSMAAFSLINSSQKGDKAQLAYLGLSGARKEISKVLASEDALKNIIAANASAFSCLANGGDCRNTSGANMILTIVDKGNMAVNIIGTAGNVSSGLTPSGAPCNSFNAGSGNNKCPYRYQVKWRPICPAGTGPCANPPIELKADLIVSSDPDLKKPLTPRIAPSKFQVVNVHRERNDTVAEACLTVNGQVVNSAECRPLFHNTGSCPQFIVGFERDGRPICGNMAAFRCPAGQVLIGLNTDGSFRCERGCASIGSFTGGFLF